MNTGNESIDFFKGQITQKVKNLEIIVAKMDTKIDSFLHDVADFSTWKSKVIGGIAVIVVIIPIIITLITLWLVSGTGR